MAPTIRQAAYAKHKLGGAAKSKKQLALMSGYSPSVAESVADHIENTVGYHNAVADLAGETGNMVMRIYHTLEKKDLSKESVPVLLEAVRTMASAWETFTPKQSSPTDNPLRGILLQHVERQTINAAPKKPKE